MKLGLVTAVLYVEDREVTCGSLAFVVFASAN